MTKRCMVTVLGAALVAGALALVPTGAQAQQIQITGPLANADACRHCRIYRQGRISISPLVGFSLRDEFDRTIFFGASAEYHITDWLGIGGFFAFGGVHLNTGLTDQVNGKGVSTERNRLSLPCGSNNAGSAACAAARSGFDDQIGQITFVAAPQILFIPLRGKLALFQKVFIDTDFYFHLGFAIIGLDERADVPGDPAGGPSTVCAGAPVPAGCVATQQARASRITFNATFGAGMRLYINDVVAITLEWRGLPFRWNTSGTDESGSPDGDFPDGIIDSHDRIRHFNQMVSVGASIYLPTSARISE